LVLKNLLDIVEAKMVSSSGNIRRQGEKEEFCREIEFMREIWREVLISFLKASFMEAVFLVGYSTGV